MASILYTTAQIAAACGREVRTIREHVRLGYISPVPASRLPPGIKGHRFSEASVSKYINERMGQPIRPRV